MSDRSQEEILVTILSESMKGKNSAILQPYSRPRLFLRPWAVGENDRENTRLSSFITRRARLCRFARNFFGKDRPDRFAGDSGTIDLALLSPRYAPVDLPSRVRPRPPQLSRNHRGRGKSSRYPDRRRYSRNRHFRRLDGSRKRDTRQ